MNVSDIVKMADVEAKLAEFFSPEEVLELLGVEVEPEPGTYEPTPLCFD